jgi:hypothetical protein
MRAVISDLRRLIERHHRGHSQRYAQCQGTANGIATCKSSHSAQRLASLRWPWYRMSPLFGAFLHLVTSARLPGLFLYSCQARPMVE